MKNKIQELHDSYKSIEARKAVDFIWGIADKSVPFEELYEIIKSIADDSEYVVKELHKLQNIK